MVCHTEKYFYVMLVQNVFKNVNMFGNFDEYKRTARFWLRVSCIMYTWIINTSFSSKLMNGPNKLVLHYTRLKDFTMTNTLAYWDNSQFTKKMKRCE
jgi:hypothetical protein